MHVFMKLYTEIFIFFIQSDRCALLKQHLMVFFILLSLNHNCNYILKRQKMQFKCDITMRDEE